MENSLPDFGQSRPSRAGGTNFIHPLLPVVWLLVKRGAG